MTIPTSDPLADAILRLADSIAANQAHVADQQAQLAETLAALRASQPPREITFGDTAYQEKLRADTKVLTRPAYQNGFAVNPADFSDEVIDRLAHLAPGTYLGGVVRVWIGGDDAVHLTYKNRTPDQRMELQRHFGSFEELVNKIWAEMHRVRLSA